MRILLVDVDSRIPNLALMKLSAFHKALDDEVGFNIADPDFVNVSVIYKRNAWKAAAIREMFVHMGKKVCIGGVGWNFDTLDPKVEEMKPDYDLYPSEYSMGFTTRGCFRSCPWCVVPEKEGAIQRWHHPRRFHDFRFDTIMVLDNNWLALTDWFFDTSEWIREHDLTLWEHGLDIRLVTRRVGKQLLKLRMKNGYHFAFDQDSLEPVVRKKIRLLKEVGFNLRSDVQFYVYVDSDAWFKSGLRRARLLKDLGTNAFIMFNINQSRTQRIKDLQRWTNRKALFWSMDFDEYNRRATEA